MPQRCEWREDHSGQALAPNGPLTIRAVFVFGRGDLTVFEALEQASNSIEAVDARAHEYDVVYDDPGQFYDIRVSEEKVELVPSGHSDYKDLVSRLKVVAQRAGMDLPSDEAQLPLAVARSTARRDWERRWPKHPQWLSRHIHVPAPPSFAGP